MAEHPYLPAYALLNDEPVAEEEHDLLGVRQAAARLTALIAASRTATPFTLAVDAGWGMGKSSLMRLVDVQLSRFPGIRTVWYNAWTSTGPDALEGLIKSVLAQLDPNVLRRWVRRLRGGGPVAALLRAATVLAAGPFGAGPLVDQVWRGLSADAGARNTMRDALGELVGAWVDGQPDRPGRTLVVFIDDLDRCSEETFLAVCEAVKVYLDVPGLAFVIGCDRAAIHPGGLLRDLSPAGLAFVEKIFQTSYRIPVPSSFEIRSYVLACARQAGIEALLDPAAVELLAYRAERNPRRVKRLVNGLLLEASLNPMWSGIRPQTVIRALLVQYLYPDFYRMMTTPAGPADWDPVVEFLGYRRVRAHLLGHAAWSSATAGDVNAFLGQYDLPPTGGGPTSRGRVLAELEQYLPAGFPALATDSAFVSLVQDLMAQADSVLALRRLREGMDGSFVWSQRDIFVRRTYPPYQATGEQGAPQQRQDRQRPAARDEWPPTDWPQGQSQGRPQGQWPQGERQDARGATPQGAYAGNTQVPAPQAGQGMPYGPPEYRERGPYGTDPSGPGPGPDPGPGRWPADEGDAAARPQGTYQDTSPYERPPALGRPRRPPGRDGSARGGDTGSPAGPGPDPQGTPQPASDRVEPDADTDADPDSVPPTATDRVDADPDTAPTADLDPAPDRDRAPARGLDGAADPAGLPAGPREAPAGPYDTGRGRGASGSERVLLAGFGERETVELAASLRGLGIGVLTADPAAVAEGRIEPATGADVLVAHADAGSRLDAGFLLAEYLRERGLVRGAVLYAPRATPAGIRRAARAEGLLLTDRLEELPQLAQRLALAPPAS